MEIEIKGDEELFRKLDKLTKVGSKKAMASMGLTLSSKMQDYPTQRSSTYDRTFDLLHGWRVKAKMRSALVYNRVPYAKYVQSEKYQSKTHRGHWQTLKKTAEDNMDEIVAILKKQVDRILRSG